MTKKMYVLLIWILFLPYVGFSGEIQTPLERDNFTKLSSHADMMTYLKKLDSQSKILTVSTIGKSVQGRELPALFFSLDKSFGSKRAQKPIVLIFCQQHGNEPSGKEGALMVARDLATQGKNILKNLDLILVPQVNSDGAEMEQRKNANDMDLNRNHVILSEPEVIALHRLFLKWQPEVTLDVHEYNAISKQWIVNGYIKDAEEMLDRVTNLNIARSIIQFSQDVFIPEVGKFIQEDGFSFHRYIVGSPFEHNRVRHSTTDINDGRQSMGIYNTISFIVEGKRYGDLLTKIKRRAAGQKSAITAFLKTVANHRAEILNTVRSAREELLVDSQQSNEYSYIQLDYFSEPGQETLSFPVFDFYKWRRVEKKLKNYEPIVKVKKSVVRPFAYVFSQKEQKLIDLLLKHEIKMFRLQADSEIEVEAYTIQHVTPIMEEDKPTINVDTRLKRETRKLSKGSVVVKLNQKAANLIPLLLEPQSSWSIVTERSGRKYRFTEFIQEGQEYPIFRIVSPVKLELEEIEKTD